MAVRAFIFGGAHTVAAKKYEGEENVIIYNRYSDGVNKPNGEDKSCSDFKSFIDDFDNPKDFIMAYIFK